MMERSHHRLTVTGAKRLRVNRRRFLGGSAAIVGSTLLAPNVIAAAPKADSTPVGDDLTPLMRLVRLLPGDQMVAAAGSGIYFFYADLESQLARLGIDQDGEYQTGAIGAATIPLALGASVFQNALSPDFLEVFGFQPLNVHRTLISGAIPTDITIFQGGFDRDLMISAWESGDYAQKTLSDGSEFWTAGEEGEVSPTTKVGRYGLGALNNALFIDDETVVFTRISAQLETIVQQIADDDLSLLDQPGIEPTLAALSDDVVSLIAIASNLLSVDAMVGPQVSPEQMAQVEDLLASSDDEVGAMPRVDVAVFAVRVGAVGLAGLEDDSSDEDIIAQYEDSFPNAEPIDGVPSSKVEVLLHAASADDAELVAEVVAWRWEHFDSVVTQAPYSDLMTLVEAGEQSSARLQDSTVAAIEFDSGIAGGRWYQLVMRQDLLPFAS